MLLTAALLFTFGSTIAPLPHDPGLSSLRIIRSSEATVAHAAFANADFGAVVAIDGNSDGAIDAAELAAANATLADLLAPLFVLRTAAGATRPDTVTARLAANNDVELELGFATVPAGGVLQVEFLDRLSRGHRCYASVVEGPGGAIVVDALLSPVARDFAVPAVEAGSHGFGQASEFLVLGIEHILLGFDHLAFLLALLVAGVTLRRAVATITAFTIAHSVTLVAAALGLVGLPGLLVEASIAASIVWVAVMNLLPRPGASPHRWPVAFAFGLVHGFGFAGVLADLDIGGPDMLVPLLCFNLGVELGQLAFALAVVPVLWWLLRRRDGARIQAGLSIGVGLAGVYWFVERVFA